MFKKIFITSFTTVVISFFCGDRASDLITCLFNEILISDNNLSHIKKVFTKEELKLYNGVEKPKLYLAILGNIFDVTEGARHYGPNQQYHVFVGRDASRSFVTGNFDENELSEDVADFNQQELRSLNHWIKFYQKKYDRVGKLIGKYFDENGHQTPYTKLIKELINQAEEAKKNSDLDKVKYPPCNIEWNADMGTRVWCSDRSGGIVRDWIGVPRQLYEPGSKTYRCACINTRNKNSGNIKEYEGCGKRSVSCYVNS